MTIKTNKQTKIGLMLMSLCLYISVTTLTFSPAHAQDISIEKRTLEIPQNFKASIVIDGLTYPIDMLFTPSGDMWVLEKGVRDANNPDMGTAAIYAVRDGIVTDHILEFPVNPTENGGALSMILDPNFTTNHYFYVWYVQGTAVSTFNSTAQLSRFTYDPASGMADSSSEYPIISVTSNQYTGLNFGGGMAFDEDGYLLLATGDFDLDETSSPQNTLSLVGKLLRIKPNHNNPTFPYSTFGNPFTANSNYLPEIYAIGTRNPYRMTRRDSDGLILFGDVGRFHWEEVNEVISEANYGWPLREGACHVGSWGPCTPLPTGFTNPLHAYQHKWLVPTNRAGAITALDFYEGTSFSQFVGQGDLLYTDFALGTMNVLDMDTLTDLNFIEGLTSPVDMEFKDDILYLVDIGLGSILAIQHTQINNSAPSVDLTASTTFITAPATITYSANATDADGDLLTFTYDFGDGTTLITTSAVVTHTYLADQTVTANVTANDDKGTPSFPSHETVTIYSGELPTIVLENVFRNGATTYHAGDSIIHRMVRSNLDGLAADPFRWDILLHHGTHIHPFESGIMQQDSITTIPIENHEGATNVWYEWVLTMKTDTGQLIRVRENLYPELMSYTVASNLPGAPVQVNGISVTTTETISTVIGTENRLQGTFFVRDGIPYVANQLADNGTLSLHFGEEITFIATPTLTIEWVINYVESMNRLFIPYVNIK